LERLGSPVDLVGHDWGGGFVLRVVSLRPDLVRSWVTDAAALTDPDFAWHEFAKLWQTPGDGEGFMEGWLSLDAEQRATTFASSGDFVASGGPGQAALAMAQALDRTMTDTILTLYRSAVRVNEQWGPAFADIPKPGLVIVPSEDVFLEGSMARRAGERAGARIVPLEGLGHWWMLQDSARGARLLEEFWAGLG
jgi:pimeloyl-ACP methyl ester carboxylesterase